MNNSDNKKSKCFIYLRIRPDFEKTNEYDSAFNEILNSYGECEWESQSGMCDNSYNGSDEGYELFSFEMSFDLAKQIALKIVYLWKVGVIELNINNQSICMKYSEPTLVGRAIPDLPIISETYHLNKYHKDHVIYKTIIFDISGINTYEDFMEIKTKHISYNSPTPKKIIIELSKLILQFDFIINYDIN